MALGAQERNVELQMDGDAIEITGITSRDQRRLIDAWIARRTGGA